MGKDYERIFVTSDWHGNTGPLYMLNAQEKLTDKDLVVSCGDFGVPFVSKEKLHGYDKDYLEFCSAYKADFAIIQGNHSRRFEKCKFFRSGSFCGDTAFYSPKYPNFHFLKNGSTYTINGMSFLVMGGGYSVDKFHRLSRGLMWEKDEQLNDEEKEKIDSIISAQSHFDFVLSHVAPYELRPTWLFLSGIDQSLVDNTQELFLSKVRQKIDYNGWFFGHYHGDYIMGSREYMVYEKHIQIMDDKSLRNVCNLRNNPQ